MWNWYLQILIFLSPFFVQGQWSHHPYPDNSLPDSNFVAMGLPALDSQWNAEDYFTGLKLLEEILRQDKFSLPRKNSPNSSGVFNKISDPRNLTYLISSDIDPKKRIYESDKFQMVVSRLLALYVETDTNKERFSSEVLSLIEFWLVYLKIRLDLAIEEKNNSTVQGEQSLLLQNGVDFNRNYFSQIHIRITTLITQGNQRHDQKSLYTFSGNFFRYLENNWNSINPESQEKIIFVLKKALVTEQDKRLKKDFNIILKKLNKE